MSEAAVRFSILTVTLNAAAHLPRCLDSVAAQRFSSFEHVIVDGASQDGTQALLAARGACVRFVSEPDKGIYDAMNKAIALARGEYLLFLGADDYLMDPQVLGDADSHLRRLGDPDFAYGDIEVRGADGSRSVFRPPEPEAALDLMICGCLPHQASFAHRRLFEKLGGFDDRYKVQADYDWFLRVLGAAGVRIAHVDRIIASFAMGGASSSLRQGQQETYAIQNAFPLYQEPEWMKKRLEAFQSQLLEHRLRLQDYEQGGGRVSLLRRVARKALGLLRS